MRKILIPFLIVLMTLSVKAGATSVVTQKGKIHQTGNSFSITKIFKKSNTDISFDGEKYVGQTPTKKEIVIYPNGEVYIDGYKKKLKVKVKEDDIYMYYKDFRKIGFTVDRYSGKYYVILPYIYENHLIYSELYNIKKDRYKQMYVEQDLWDRLKKSKKFKKVNKNTLKTRNGKIRISRPENYTKEYMTARDREDIFFYIKEKNFTLKNRRTVKKYLKIAFPTKYNRVYKTFTKVIRQEKWQDNDGFNGHPSYNSFYSKNKFLNKRGYATKYYRLYNGNSYATISISRYMTEYRTHMKYDGNVSSMWKKKDHLYKSNIKKYKLNRR